MIASSNLVKHIHDIGHTVREKKHQNDIKHIKLSGRTSMSNTPKIVPGVEETVALLEVARHSNRWASLSSPSSLSLSLSRYCHHLSSETGIKLKAAQPTNHQQPTSQPSTKQPLTIQPTTTTINQTTTNHPAN